MTRAALARPSQAPPDRSIAVNVVLPYGRRVFGIDPIVTFLGAPLEAILSSLMRQPKPMVRHASTTGPVLEVFPLAIPDGEGAAIPLGGFGELGFANDGGVLVLTVPVLLAREAAKQFGDAVVGGPTQVPTADGNGTAAELRVELRTGMRKALQVGVLGEVAIEAAR